MSPKTPTIAPSSSSQKAGQIVAGKQEMPGTGLSRLPGARRALLKQLLRTVSRSPWARRRTVSDA